MTWAVPTVAEFKTYFLRDFNFAPVDDPTNTAFVTDADLLKVLGTPASNPNDGEAYGAFNLALFDTAGQATHAFMHLAAFYLILDLQNSMQGLSSQSKFPISSTGVGSVNVSYSIPQKYLSDPFLGQFAQNGYGLKYLSLVLPLLRGNVQWVPGTTTFG